MFLYDQQSSTGSLLAEADAVIQTQHPAQSFTPALASVGFISLLLADLNGGNGAGATVYINLSSNSVTGPIISSTDPVFMPDSFGGGGGNVTNFLFAAAVLVSPGTTYYFDPVVQSGDLWVLYFHTPTDYPGGTSYMGGTPFGGDLWFREGVVVPEPSSISLLGLGSSLVFIRYFLKKRRT